MTWFGGWPGVIAPRSLGLIPFLCLFFCFLYPGGTRTRSSILLYNTPSCQRSGKFGV